MAVGFKCGASAIPQNATELTVTGLALPFAPQSVLAQVRQPSSDSAAVVTAYVAGAPTTDGFRAVFSAPVPAAGYVLDWSVVSQTGDGELPESATLSLGYSNLVRLVARFLGYDPAALTQGQSAEIDDYVQTGVRNFYYPPASEGADANFEWSFMRMAGGASLSAGVGDYLLPDGFGRVAGFPVCAPVGSTTGRSQVLAVVSRQDVELMRRRCSSGMPRLAAFVPVKDTFGVRGQRMRLMVAPVPDAAYDLTFAADADAGRLDAETRPFPLGGSRFAELVAESCLAVAEQRANDEEGLHTRNFQRQLVAAVAKDRKTGASVYGPMSGARPACCLPDHFPVTYKGDTW